MKNSGWRLGSVLFAVALMTIASSTQAATTVMQVRLGDTFTGTIGAAGVDTVEAHFNAVEGTPVRITAQAMRGSTVQPTITLRNAAGTPITVGRTLNIEWIPTPNAIHFFTVPVSGSYVAEIGGASGSGDFRGSLTGRAPRGTVLAALSGTVTNGFSGDAIPNASISVGPYVFVTDAAGAYSGEIPVGNYSVTIDAPGFVTANDMLDLSSGPAVFDVGLLPTTPVVLGTSVSGDEMPGGTVTATVSVTAQDGSMVQSIAWTQLRGAAAIIVGGDTDTATVTLGDESAYKNELIHVLEEPPVTAEQLPPNVPLPPGEFVGGLQDRFQVVGINPFSLEEAGLVVLEVEVTTTSGTYTEEVEIHSPLPWRPAAGIRDVPIGTPVVLHGKDQASYDWALTLPAGSGSTLIDGTTQSPVFTPDIPGLYEVEVTDLAAAGLVTLEIWAGNWRGVIVGQDFAGRPVSDTACTTCHSGAAPDMFTPWAQTGHAEIFTNNLNTSNFYRSSCFPCHTVGYDPGIANSGWDEAPDNADFLGAGLLGNPGDNWSTVLDDYPATAQLTNIQCENCHGPQSADPGVDNLAHGWNAPSGEPRVDISSDVCAVCHGEPLRHARFQQWQLSGHANYELAIDEGDSGNCSRCHTGNGFLTWLPILQDDDPNTDPTASITVSWTTDETHPQTCVTCHDPHNIGTTSGNNTNVNIRISDDTPPLIAGFTANDVGRGAMCMTCHNSRRGLRNDDTFDDYVGTSEAARAAHGSAQTDVLMGQNAYLVSLPQRGSHAFLEDTCVTCHMQVTPPPDILAYNQGGANHTFFASRDICAECHGNLTADSVQVGVGNLLDDLQGLVEDALLSLMGDVIAAGNTIDLNGDTVITDTADVQEIVFGEFRGRQSITVTFTDMTTFGPYRLTDVDVVDGTPAVIGQLYDFAPDDLIKAGWNWGLFHNDGSLGVHNPFFALDALAAARNALWALPSTAFNPIEESPEVGTRTRDRTVRPSRR